MDRDFDALLAQRPDLIDRLAGGDIDALPEIMEHCGMKVERWDGRMWPALDRAIPHDG